MTAANPHEDSAAGNSPVLPTRPGPRPQATPWAPHIQQDQNAAADMQAILAQRVFALPEVEERPGTVAHPAERAIWLRDQIPPRRGMYSSATGRSAIFTLGTAACTSSWTPSSLGPRSRQDGLKSIPSPWPPGSPRATGSCSTAPATKGKSTPYSA